MSAIRCWMATMRTRTLVAVLSAAVVVVAGSAGGFVYVAHRHETQLDSQARAVIGAYAKAWTDGGLGAIAYAGAEPAAVAASFSATTGGLRAVHPAVSVGSTSMAPWTTRGKYIVIGWKPSSISALARSIVLKPSAKPRSENNASCMHGPLAPKGASRTPSRLRST